MNGRRPSSCAQLEWRMKGRSWRKWLPFDLRGRRPSPSRFIDYSKFLVQLMANALAGILSVRETPCLTNPNSTFQTPKNKSALCFCSHGPCLFGSLLNHRSLPRDLACAQSSVRDSRRIHGLLAPPAGSRSCIGQPAICKNPSAETNGRHAS